MTVLVQPLPSKRHLPVIKAPESATPHTSAWVWLMYACVVIVSLWVPLAMVALLLGGRLGLWLTRFMVARQSSSPVLLLPAAALVLFSFAIACSVGGAVLGRFSQRSRRFDGALAAAGAAAIILVFATLGRAFPSVAFAVLVGVCLFALGPLAGTLGFRWARRNSSAAPGRDNSP